eukprot:6199426-Pleurochrysis_carterae.AAC.1
MALSMRCWITSLLLSVLNRDDAALAESRTAAVTPGSFGGGRKAATRAPLLGGDPSVEPSDDKPGSAAAPADAPESRTGGERGCAVREGSASASRSPAAEGTSLRACGLIGGSRAAPPLVGKTLERKLVGRGCVRSCPSLGGLDPVEVLERLETAPCGEAALASGVAASSALLDEFSETRACAHAADAAASLAGARMFGSGGRRLGEPESGGSGRQLLPTPRASGELLRLLSASGGSRRRWLGEAYADGEGGAALFSTRGGLVGPSSAEALYISSDLEGSCLRGLPKLIRRFLPTDFSCLARTRRMRSRRRFILCRHHQQKAASAMAADTATAMPKLRAVDGASAPLPSTTAHVISSTMSTAMVAAKESCFRPFGGGGGASPLEERCISAPALWLRARALADRLVATNSSVGPSIGASTDPCASTIGQFSAEQPAGRKVGFPHIHSTCNATWAPPANAHA